MVQNFGNSLYGQADKRTYFVKFQRYFQHNNVIGLYLSLFIYFFFLGLEILTQH